MDDEELRLAEVCDDGRIAGAVAEARVADVKDVDAVGALREEIVEEIADVRASAHDRGNTAEVRTALSAEKPLGARLHLDRSDRVDHHRALRADAVEELLRHPRFFIRHL